MLVDYVERSSRKSRRIIEDVAAWQGAERRIQVIKARVGEGEGQAAHAKLFLNYMARGSFQRSRSLSKRLRQRSYAIAGTFERYPFGHLHDFIEDPARHQCAKPGCEHWLLALAFWMEETGREDGLAVQHDGGIGDEH